MKMRADLAETTERISRKQPVLQPPALRLWKQLTPQQQKHLAKHWAQLLRRVQLSPELNKEVRDVEN